MKNNRGSAPCGALFFDHFSRWEGIIYVSTNGEKGKKSKKGATSLKKIEDRVSLTKVAPQHIEPLREFTLHKQQLAFTSMPILAYEKCLLDQKRFPVAILEGDRPVGFFVLDQGADVWTYSKSTHAILLRAFSINLPYQGRGIAKASLQQLQPFVKTHLPHCREVVLGVNQNNPSAKKVYLGAGFIDTGKEKIGRSGPMAILKFFI